MDKTEARQRTKKALEVKKAKEKAKKEGKPYVPPPEEPAPVEKPVEGPKVNLGGQPPKEFDKEVFEKLCDVQCTVNEIEYILGSNQTVIDFWCQRTYERSFAEMREQLRMGGKASLRRMQFKLAETNASMAIFLGKNILEQTDQIVQKIETKQEIVQKKILNLPDNGRRKVSDESTESDQDDDD